ncbi:MAG: hypothetical protein WKG06_46570 [Segetibacter sp.]
MNNDKAMAMTSITTDTKNNCLVGCKGFFNPPILSASLSIKLL